MPAKKVHQCFFCRGTGMRELVGPLWLPCLDMNVPDVAIGCKLAGFISKVVWRLSAEKHVKASPSFALSMKW